MVYIHIYYIYYIHITTHAHCNISTPIITSRTNSNQRYLDEFINSDTSVSSENEFVLW